MELRDYQTDAVTGIWDYFTEGNEGNPIVAMPTGTGKSLVIAGFLRRIFEHYPQQKVMMVTHVKELIEQNFEKLLLHWPTAPAGIYSAGLGRKEASPKIVFGGIGTVRNCPELFGKVDLLLIDECHLVSPKSNTSYRKFIDALLEVNPALKVIGFTATQYRLGLGPLVDGELFTDVCYDITNLTDFNRLVAQGYLAPLVPKRTGKALNIEGVKMHGGEFALGQLQDAVNREEITNGALSEAMELGYNRHHWLIFATGIEHAQNIGETLNTWGVPTGVIHSKIPASERKELLAAYERGELRALVNNNVLTTGFDSPWIDMLLILRPTASPGLWVQMLGRGTRPYPGKENCLVLDFARNTTRLGPINDPVMPRKKGKGGGVAPVRECPHCHTYNHASLRFCCECGVEFPLNVKFGVFAGTESIMKDDTPLVEVFDVSKVVYSRHLKQGAPDSILATYYCGLRRFKTYVCIEHQGGAKGLAYRWWKRHTTIEPPISVTGALTLTKHLAVPTQIRVWLNKKYPEILDYGFQENPLTETV